MIRIKKLLLMTMFASLGSMIYGMEKEQPALSELPLEVRHSIASLLLAKTVEHNYNLMRKINIGVKAPIRLVVVSPDGKTILTTLDGTIVRLWAVESCKQLKEFETGRLIDSAAFSPDGKTILIGALKIARLWDVESGKQLKEFNVDDERIDSVLFSSDGNKVLTRSDESVRLYEVKTGKQLEKFKKNYSRNFITSAAFSSDGNSVFVGSLDSTARIRNVKTGKKIKFIGSEKSVWSVVFSLDGKTILTGYTDGAVRLWEVKSGKQLKEFIGHTDSITSVAFSPDGTTILTGSDDTTARLWDIESCKQLKLFTGHTPVHSVAFSADGSALFTGAEDAIVVYTHKESQEDIKERFAQLGQAMQKDCQEKCKLIINNPFWANKEEISLVSLNKKGNKADNEGRCSIQ